MACAGRFTSPPRLGPAKRFGSIVLPAQKPVVKAICFSVAGQAYDRSGCSANHHRTYRSLAEQQRGKEDWAASFFANALVRAGLCSKHSNKVVSQKSPGSHACRRADAPARRLSSASSNARRYHQTTKPWSRPRKHRFALSREECLRMLDYYSGDYATHAPSEIPFAGLTSEDAKKAAESFEKERILKRPPKETDVPSQEDKSQYTNDMSEQVQRLFRALANSSCTHDEAWEAYSALPPDILMQIPGSARNRLLTCLSVTRRKSQLSMIRYLSVLDTMKAHGLPLVESQWNSAIAFAAREFHNIDARGLEAALLKWKEMEQEARIKSGSVTFNILFDLATKAGKFTLAEMVMREMDARKLELNRYARTAVIYYYGQRGDSDGIREAFRDLVNSGQIVDTLVINCLIASLLRASEHGAAFSVYLRMKQVYHNLSSHKIESVTWQEKRQLGRMLLQVAKRFKDKPDSLAKVQARQILAPNIDTFNILINHHVMHTGELLRVGSLLGEMHELSVPADGRIFVKIFKGFALHGNARYTMWTSSHLHSVWECLLDVLDDTFIDVHLDRWLAVWVIRAMRTCSGRQRALDAWVEVSKRWQKGPQELDIVQQMVRTSLQPDSPQSNGPQGLGAIF